MTEGEGLSEAMERFERNIEREVTKLKYYLEPADELIEQNDYVEMEIAVKQGTQIIDKITDLISQLEGMKLNSGVSPRDVRQWKRTRRTSSLLSSRRKSSFPRHFQQNRNRRKTKSSERIGRHDGSARNT